LGRRTIYTLKPEDCYDYALKLIEAIPEKSALKVNMKVESKMVQIDYLPASPPAAKQRRKTIKKNAERPNSEFIDQSPTSVFDDVNSSPMSAEERSVYSFNAGNDLNSNPRLSSSSSNKHFFNALDGGRSRSNTFNGQLSFNGVSDPDLPSPESILLHEVAYCVTVPEKPRLFLLTSRGNEGLTCRVFLFSSREKAQLLKGCLARQFEIAYTEWQSRLLRRASRRRSSLLNRQTSQSSLNDSNNTILNGNESQLATVPEPFHHSCHVDCGLEDGMDHGSSSEEEDPFVDHEMHREFKRRASCLANPERLLVGEEEMNDLNQRFKTTLKRNDAFSGSLPSSDEDKSN